MTDPRTALLNIGGHVLAAVDASAYADSVARYAAWAARCLDAPLEFVHVLDRHPEAAATADFSGNLDPDAQARLLQDLTALDEARGRVAQERGRLLLQQSRATAADAHGVDAQTRLRHGELSGTLTALEADVRLFVLGKRGEHADFAKGHLGGELERVVRAVHRPLLVASRAYAQVRRVLVAFDGSATTRKGIEMVAASPLFRGLDIHVVTAGARTGVAVASQRWALDALSAAGLSASASLVQGEAEDAIGRMVREQAIDLLVMGAYGHSRIRQFIVGSTTTTLLRTCQVPVLLLR